MTHIIRHRLRVELDAPQKRNHSPGFLQHHAARALVEYTQRHPELDWGFISAEHRRVVVVTPRKRS